MLTILIYKEVIMSKFCPKCKLENNDESKFCLNCGTQLGENSYQSTQTQAQTNSIDMQQGNNQATAPASPPPLSPQGYNQPMQSKSSNNKLIFAIIAIIVIVVVAAVVLLISGGLGGTDSRFVGTWEQDAGYMSIDWVFKSDGKLTIMNMEIAEWSVNGDKLCIKADDAWVQSMPSGSDTETCYNYAFSDSGNTLTLSASGVSTTTLTKK